MVQQIFDQKKLFGPRNFGQKNLFQKMFGSIYDNISQYQIISVNVGKYLLGY